MRPVAFELGKQIEAGRAKGAAPVNPKKASGSKGNQNSLKGEHLMKTITKSKSMRRRQALLLSVLCASVIATFIGGCAEAPYVTAYDGGYYYPTAYYTPAYYDYGYPYSYYEPTYSRTVVRPGVRYYNSYGPRYYTTTYGY